MLKKLLMKKKAIIFACVMLIVVGISIFGSMPKQKMPDTTPPVGNYQLIAPGYHSEEVYELVVSPIEEAIMRVIGVSDVVATSYDNFAIVTIMLDVMEDDPEPIWTEVKSVVDGIALPEDVMEPVFNSSFDFPHVVYSITSDSAAYKDVYLKADEFATSLKTMNEIKSVSLSSEYATYIEITINQEALNRCPLTVQNVTDLIRANGKNIPLGTFESESGLTSIEAPMVYQNLETIENLLLFVSPTTKEEVYLSDIATVDLVEKARDHYYNVNGEEAVFLSVSFKDDLDFTKLGRTISELEESFTLNNSDYDVEILVFQPDDVQESMNQVTSSLIVGIILVLIVIFVGLGIRNAISIAFTFPLIVFTTVLILSLLGESLQMISIAGLIITIGIIVDNAIVISEAIQFNIEAGMEKNASILKAVNQNAMPVLASTLTTIAAFATLMFIPGVAGKMMFSLPLTVIIAITLSYIVAMLIIPIVAGTLYKPRKNTRRNKAANKIGQGLSTLTKKVLKRPKMVILVSVIVFMFSITAGLAGQELGLFPPSEESIIYVNYEYVGDQINMSTKDFAKHIVTELTQLSGLEYYAYSVGGDIPRFDMSVVPLSPLPTGGRVYLRFDTEYDAIASLMNDVETMLITYEDIASFEVKELTMGAGFDVGDVTIYVESAQVSNAVSVTEAIEMKLSDSSKVGAYRVTYPIYQDKQTLVLNRETIAMMQTVNADIQMQIRTLLADNPSTFAKLDGEKTPIIVNTDINSEDRLNTVGIVVADTKKPPNQMDSTYAMNKVALNEIATFSSFDSLYSITTINGEHQLAIDISVPNRKDLPDITTHLDDLFSGIDMNGVEVTYGGGIAESMEQMADIGVAGALAVAIIFFIMLIVFDSFKQPFVVLLTIPLSFIGCVLIMRVFSVPMNTFVMIGVVALMGIVVNSGILLVDYINIARKEGLSVYDACVKSVKRRIRPILLSVFTTVFGLIPLALSGDAIFRPMSLTLIGGLLVSTILTLFVIPSMYMLVEKEKKV